MSKKMRKIIKIDEEKCNGCGQCVPNCMEGALQIIDHKARLVSDLFCDGLGACIGHCPEDAISIEERDAEPYDERKVMETIVAQGANTIKAHLTHLREHNAQAYYEEALSFIQEKGIKVPELENKDNEQQDTGQGGCSGSRVMVDFNRQAQLENRDADHAAPLPSALSTWPVQLMLVPPQAPYLNNADLLIAADCVAYSYAGFHRDFMQNKVTIIACPKLDDRAFYLEKLTRIFEMNKINSITIAHMEVPCCFGLLELVKQSIAACRRTVPVTAVNISVKGEIQPARPV